jgi:hypothetical protein
MIPNQVLSSTVIRSALLYPDNAIRRTELEDFEMGGVALQDPSQGLRVVAWKGVIDAVTRVATLTPVTSTAPPIVIFTETVTPVEFSFSFDRSMREFSITRFADNTAKLRWYDTAIPAYVTTTYTGIQSCMLALDDKRDVSSSIADVIFTYLKTDNKLYFRAQRDRFLVEYTLTDVLAPNLAITNFGMGRNNRLQWRIAVRRVL